MLAEVDRSPYIQLYREQVSKGLRFDEKLEPTLRLPAYDGSTELGYAHEMPGAVGAAS
jgi:hypothetical protein